MAKNNRGRVLWKGASLLDGKPIVLLATKGKPNSANEKTGNLIQTYILRRDILPQEAINTGQASSICGDCPHIGKGCYVRVEQGPTQVFKAYQRGSYPVVDLQGGRVWLAGKKVRLGAYGDPAAIPLFIWETVLADVEGVTGYTHAWNRATSQGLERYCMASCDTAQQTLEARSIGWRTFSVVSPLSESPEEVKAHAFLCPASKQAGYKLTCAECMACGGLSSPHKASVYIPVHGANFKQSKFMGAQSNLIQIGG